MRSVFQSNLQRTITPVRTISKAYFQNKPRRPNIAGEPKGLPPKIVKQEVILTPAEIQAEEEKQRFIFKRFYQSKVQWKPHPKLEKCNDVTALEHYLWDHQQRLQWFRGQIADESRRSVRRSYLRTHISIHKLNCRYIQNKIYELKGELAIPKLLPENAPTYTCQKNPYFNELKITARIPRDYDYPGKAQFEPLARQQAEQRLAAAATAAV